MSFHPGHRGEPSMGRRKPPRTETEPLDLSPARAPPPRGPAPPPGRARPVDALPGGAGYGRVGAARERQLDLLSQTPSSVGDDASADDVLDKINREIAIYQMQTDGEVSDELQGTDGDMMVDDLSWKRPTGGKRVKFESLRGDLPPELQE
jgi:hypothetical protein